MITEPIHDYEFHCRECKTCGAAKQTYGRKAIGKRFQDLCSVGKQLHERAVRSLKWKVPR